MAAPLHLETHASGVTAAKWILSGDTLDRTLALGEPLAIPLTDRPDHLELHVSGAHDAITLHDQNGDVIPGRVHRAGTSVFAALAAHVTHITPRHALGTGRRTALVTVQLYPKEARA